MPRTAGALVGRSGEPGVVLREHLLDTAERLLSANDVGSITTRGLAKAAGVSTGVLYNYFADKDQLVLAAFLRRFAILVSAVCSELPDQAEGTIDGRLERLADSLYEFHAASIPLLGRLVAQPSLLHQFLLDIHHRDQPFGGQQVRDAVVHYLTDEGLPDAEVAADMLIGSVGLLALTELVNARDGRQKRRSARVVQILLHGLDRSNTR